MRILKSISNWHSKFRRKLIQKAYSGYVINEYKKKLKELGLKGLYEACQPASYQAHKPGKSVNESLWDDFKKTECCPDCEFLRGFKSMGGRLMLTKQTDAMSITRPMEINYCIVCGKKIEEHESSND